MTHCPLFDTDRAERIESGIAELTRLASKTDATVQFWLGNGSKPGEIQHIREQVAEHERIIIADQVAKEVAAAKRKDLHQTMSAIGGILAGLAGILGLGRYVVPWLLR